MSLYLKYLGIAILFSASLSPSWAGSVWDQVQKHYPGSLNIKVFYSPSCGCCKDWLDHLDRHSFNVTSIETKDINAIKTKHRLPHQVASCHTALIDGYIIEGHVPANDIKRLLKQRPAIRGLAVPQMPVGTPGMEMGARKDPFVVISFDEKGKTETFNQYWSY